MSPGNETLKRANQLDSMLHKKKQLPTALRVGKEKEC